MSSFGIDFGTTTTAISELDETAFRDFGPKMRPLRSVVALDRGTGEVFVGPEVQDHVQEHEASGNYEVIRSIKSSLASGGPWRAGRKTWTPAMIVAEILKALNKEVTVQSGIQAATFSVPVGFPPASLRILREAASLAAIRVNGIIKESTAAVFRHLHRVRGYRHVAVFDWGGGTLDVSVLEIRGGVIYERYTAGMAEAGDRIDEAIARRVHSQFIEGKSFDDMHAHERDLLTVRCELAKCRLSTNDFAEIQVSSYDGKPLTYKLTRMFCRPAVEPVVRKAIDTLASAISGAGLSPDAVNQIIVIGGSSRLWLLRELIEADERFASTTYFSERPEWDVARGAAIVDNSPGCYSAAETIALQLSDGSYYELVRPGDRIDGGKRVVNLALVEDVPAANVILDRWSDNGKAHRELADQFAVPTLGFDLEAVELSWKLTEDLTLAVDGKSNARGISIERREITPIRFGYDIRERIC